MITGSPQQEAADSPAKNEKSNTSTSKASSANNSSSSWLRLKDPRIVRVSRAFGGKDRHSKVCTVRGLRDRRVRLSVPTAIQLYDLQDRLGLSQPSKVVDWLLNAAKDEIDELPPLQMPPVSFPRSQEDLEGSSTSQSGKEGVRTNQNIDWNEASRSGLWNVDANNVRGKSKEVEVATHKESSQSSLSFLPYGSLCQWEPNLTTFPLSQLGTSHGFMSQLEDVRHNNAPLPSALSLSTTQPYSFPFEIDPRQMNHFQMLSSSSNHNLLFPHNGSSLSSIGQSMRPFHFSMSAPRPQDSNGSEQNKDQER